MFRKVMFIAAIGAALTPALLGGTAVQAHNAGHVILPSGECINVGGNNTVSLPETAAANTNVAGELDLIPGTPGDEFGARFAAEQGDSAVLPRACP
ncbi:MAG: hypothetical protein WD557_16555 [Dehalococcoidia bacterium]